MDVGASGPFETWRNAPFRSLPYGLNGLAFYSSNAPSRYFATRRPIIRSVIPR